MQEEGLTKWQKDYRRHKERRVCTNCGKKDERTEAGRCLCERCQEKYIARRTERRRKAKENHVCTLCGGKDSRTEAGGSYCQKCLDYCRFLKKSKGMGRAGGE